MSPEERNKAVLRRWYDEMYAEQRFEELMPELVAPKFVRHEPGGTTVTTPKEYAARCVSRYGPPRPAPRTSYDLIAENDKVGVIATSRIGDAVAQWVQVFRLEDGKLAETWVSGTVREAVW
jgi:predicted SnoaL-like aldol condensation-catalyzing enzyme